MNDLITKELLSNVFTDNQQEFKVIGIEKNILKYQWLNEEPIGDGDVNCKWVDFTIYIGDLISKCEEWASKLGYVIIPYGYTIHIFLNGVDVFNEVVPFINDGVFIACQWIIEQKSN